MAARSTHPLASGTSHTFHCPLCHASASSCCEAPGQVVIGGCPRLTGRRLKAVLIPSVRALRSLGSHLVSSSFIPSRIPKPQNSSSTSSTRRSHEDVLFRRSQSTSPETLSLLCADPVVEFIDTSAAHAPSGARMMKRLASSSLSSPTRSTMMNFCVQEEEDVGWGCSCAKYSAQLVLSHARYLCIEGSGSFCKRCLSTFGKKGIPQSCRTCLCVSTNAFFASWYPGLCGRGSACLSSLTLHK